MTSQHETRPHPLSWCLWMRLCNDVYVMLPFGFFWYGDAYNTPLQYIVPRRTCYVFSEKMLRRHSLASKWLPHRLPAPTPTLPPLDLANKRPTARRNPGPGGISVQCSILSYACCNPANKIWITNQATFCCGQLVWRFWPNEWCTSPLWSATH